MPDLVGTCPKGFWQEWIEEGDPAGALESGEEWGWWTKHSLAATIQPGERFYVVAHGRLRGYALVTRVMKEGPSWVICRRGGAVACTLATPIAGFRGLEKRWWDRAVEQSFPDWKTAGVEIKSTRKPKSAPLFDVGAK